MPFRALFILLFLLAASCLPAPRAEARLSGYATLQYGETHSHLEDEKDFDNSYWFQQYSLLWSQRRNFYGGRLGYYDLSLGAEWNLLDAEINGDSRDVDTLKPLFEGSVLVAPGGLPFRFQAYVKDLSQSQLIQTGDFGEREFSIIDGPIYDDIRNGTRIATGMTLLAGIKNGSYGGRYRDILSQFPRLFVDFSSLYVRNIEVNQKEHYLERNLAFVSLNKKDNWFHYRIYDFDDRIDPENNFQEKSYMLGTIDHLLTRHWIDLTNWIAVSVDGTYITGNRLDRTTTKEEYLINFMAQARLPSFSSATYTHFNRSREGSEVVRGLSVPVYAHGTRGRATTWRTEFSGSAEERQDEAEQRFVSQESGKVRGRIETFQNRDRQLAFFGTISALDRKEDYQDGLLDSLSLVGELGASIGANPKRNSRNLWLVSNEVSLSQNDQLQRDPETAAEFSAEGLYWENRFDSRIDFYRNSYQAGARQFFLFGSGEIIGGRAMADSGISGDQQPGGEENLSIDGEVFRSATSGYLEFDFLRYLRNRIAGTFDYYSDLGQDRSTTLVSLDYSMEYQRKEWWISFSSGMTHETLEGSDDRREFAAFGTFNLSYVPSRQTYFSLRGSASYSDVENEEEQDSAPTFASQEETQSDSLHLDVVQIYRHNFFGKNGILRRIATFEEEFRYEKRDSLEFDTWRSSLTLRMIYYPTRILEVGGELEANFFNSWSTYKLLGGTFFALKFPKLQVVGDYRYGETSSDYIVSGWEHSWNLSIRKTL